MEDLISKAKILEWLKIREEEAYANAAQTFSPSLFKGKADAFNDVAEYVRSGHFDPIPLPTIKPGDKVRHKRFKSLAIGTVKSISESGKKALVRWDEYNSAYYYLINLEVISHD